MKAAIVVNSKKKNVKTLTRVAMDVLDEHHIAYDTFDSTMKNDTCLQPMADLPKYKFIITLGGDGTLLYACRTVNVHKTPIIGVNMGTLGFITDISPNHLAETIHHVIHKKQHLQKRHLIDVCVHRKGRCIANMTGLNEMVISKSARSGLLKISYTIDGYEVNVCKADGIIVATPTGSTGHALSAGGAIVYPELSNLMIIPICPHTLTNRPLLVSGDRKISITLDNTADQDVALVVDGQRFVAIDATCRIDVKISKYFVQLVAQHPNSYWDVLKSKLGWRGHIES